MRTEPLSEEEMTERLKRAFKASPRPRTKAQLAEQTLKDREKPTVAMTQDVTLSSDALAQRLREERSREFKLADEERDRRQHALDMAVASMRGLQQEIVHSSYYKGSATVGPRDSDADLHLSPDDALWMDHHVRYSS